MPRRLVAIVVGLSIETWTCAGIMIDLSTSKKPDVITSLFAGLTDRTSSQVDAAIDAVGSKRQIVNDMDYCLSRLAYWNVKYVVEWLSKRICKPKLQCTYFR